MLIGIDSMAAATPSVFTGIEIFSDKNFVQSKVEDD